MSRLTRDGTVLPNSSRETKFSGGANADREILIIFPVQLTTSRIGNLTRVDPYSCYMCDHTHIHTTVVPIHIIIAVRTPDPSVQTNRILHGHTHI